MQPLDLIVENNMKGFFLVKECNKKQITPLFKACKLQLWHKLRYIRNVKVCQTTCVCAFYSPDKQHQASFFTVDDLNRRPQNKHQ